MDLSQLVSDKGLAVAEIIVFVGVTILFARWLANNIVIPLRDNHIEFLKRLQEKQDRIIEAIDNQTQEFKLSVKEQTKALNGGGKGHAQDH